MSNFNSILVNSFGKDPQECTYYHNAEYRLDQVRRYHDLKCDEAENKWIIDDVTWNDLEMDRMFLRINHTNSFIGEQMLYHKLHVLDKRFENFEKRLEYFSESDERRLEVENKLSYISKRRETYYMSEFLLHSNAYVIGKPWIYHVLQFLIIMACISTLVFRNTMAFAALIAMVVINLIVYFFNKQQLEIQLASLLNLKNVYAFANWMSKKDKDKIFETEAVSQALENLKGITKYIYGITNVRQGAMTGDVFAMIFEYIWGIFLIDISMFNKIMKVIENKQEDVFTLLEFVGEIDSDIAVVSYRKSIPNWCKPEFIDNGIIGNAVAHPLLKEPVANDCQLKSRSVITGANASGKSTFMKAVAINVLLSQTINTAVAESFCLKPQMIMTCMSLRDDILTGESYYFREAKYVKRIMDYIVKESSVLIVIDEILKGTNTKERIAASKAILEYIADTDCLALVATHDNELTESDSYVYYHFDSVIEDNDVKFDYKIRDGRNTSTNAIALLACLGYPDSIVKKARTYLA